VSSPNIAVAPNDHMTKTWLTKQTRVDAVSGDPSSASVVSINTCAERWKETVKGDSVVCGVVQLARWTRVVQRGAGIRWGPRPSAAAATFPMWDTAASSGHSNLTTAALVGRHQRIRCRLHRPQVQT
jgi:hypothetical protein